jgi:hypothetical protein
VAVHYVYVQKIGACAFDRLYFFAKPAEISG